MAKEQVIFYHPESKYHLRKILGLVRGSWLLNIYGRVLRSLPQSSRCKTSQKGWDASLIFL